VANRRKRYYGQSRWAGFLDTVVGLIIIGLVLLAVYRQFNPKLAGVAVSVFTQHGGPIGSPEDFSVKMRVVSVSNCIALIDSQERVWRIPLSNSDVALTALKPNMIVQVGKVSLSSLEGSLWVTKIISND
jgi:hypothetical protein